MLFGWTRSDAGAGLFSFEARQLLERFGAGFGAQRRQDGDEVAARAQGLLRPATEVELVDVVDDQAPGVDLKLAWMSLTTGRPVEKV
jgi:hypothetical protein